MRSGTQKFMLGWMPKSWQASAEAESKTWFMRCPNCGFEQSVWDWGGVRWKAAGNPKRLLTCPKCGKSGWHDTYKK
jgi:predicted RNA-binding Zn-ribbon protein involved in translation (DUF1610 family)